ncbi:uncharacterized protein LOC129808850, partial [Phlebotomus papatasi]|uniref:uncharacterized protein LOC129808850 n=1 Tax=Phlebotomus papatasi TaxID=29031 RepID=UPI002483AC87
MSESNLKVVMETLAQEKSEVELLNFLFKDKSVMKMIEMLNKGDEVLSRGILTRIKSDMELGLELLISDKKKLVKNLCWQPISENLMELLNEVLFFSNISNDHVQTGEGNADVNMQAGTSREMMERKAENEGFETDVAEEDAEVSEQERDFPENPQEDLSFGLPECDKGYYPYKFNTTENRSYIGSYPPIDMYPIESMSSQQYAEFLEWYEQVKELPFDNRKELIHYCRQDVKILMMGCLNFMFSFIETTFLNPFLQAITIADAVMKAYRKNYLTPNTLAITPKNNYNSNFLQMQSKISLKWLVYMKETSNPNIKYEVKLRGSRYIADGYDGASNTVYSFEGCFFHGHTCFLNRGHTFSKKPNDTMQSRYEGTLKRLDHIRQLGYNLISIWECEFRRMLESDPVLAERLNNHPEVVDSGFDLRSAVYGGRTEVFRTYYKCRPGDKIYYYDFTSLYPWANKYSKYFVGHPQIIKDIRSQEDVLKHDGVVKCTILPPKGLYIPCLPFRCNNRLFFTLCRKCAEDLNTDRYLHSDDERSLTGTWSIDEVRLAVDHGYVITKCFEVWAYETSQYNRETGERGLFADYVDNFLKIKQEASGWPSGVESDSDKDNYIREFFENEGIQLDKENIRVNK